VTLFHLWLFDAFSTLAVTKITISLDVGHRIFRSSIWQKVDIRPSLIKINVFTFIFQFSATEFAPSE